QWPRLRDRAPPAPVSPPLRSQVSPVSPPLRSQLSPVPPSLRYHLSSVPTPLGARLSPVPAIHGLGFIRSQRPPVPKASRPDAHRSGRPTGLDAPPVRTHLGSQLRIELGHLAMALPGRRGHPGVAVDRSTGSARYADGCAAPFAKLRRMGSQSRVARAPRRPAPSASPPRGGVAGEAPGGANRAGRDVPALRQRADPALGRVSRQATSSVPRLPSHVQRPDGHAARVREAARSL